MQVANHHKLIKSPLNYIGGKYKILPQVLPHFPNNISTFVDLFAGGGNVGINVKAKQNIFNDNLTYLIDMYEVFKKESFDNILEHIQKRILEFQLTNINEDGYLRLREHYNKTKLPLDLFALTAYSFNHQIRFNNSHQYNNPFGRNRSYFNENMKSNLKCFVNRLQQKDTILLKHSFEDFPYQILTENDFVYCDPPYLITTGTYNDGKRGFKGWREEEELLLLSVLNKLDRKNVKFALSNVLEHKGQTNNILLNWLNENNHYLIHSIENDYANSNYKTKDKNKHSTREILITNYKTATLDVQQTLFNNI